MPNPTLSSLVLPVKNTTTGEVSNQTFDLPSGGGGGGSSSVTVEHSGTASATTTRSQRIVVDSIHTDIDGTKYMEQTLTTIANQDAIFTFVNAAITDDCVIEGPYSDVAGMMYTNLTVDGTNHECEVTVNVATAITILVRIYIK